MSRITPAATVASGIGGGVLARSSAVTRSVATQSGTMQFTRMPSAAASAAVKGMSPALAAAYSGDVPAAAGVVDQDRRLGEVDQALDVVGRRQIRVHEPRPESPTTRTS